MKRKTRTILVVGPQQSYLHWLKTTRGLGDANVKHITEAKQTQGYCFDPRGNDELVDLTNGDQRFATTLAYAKSVFPQKPKETS